MNPRRTSFCSGVGLGLGLVFGLASGNARAALEAFLRFDPTTTSTPLNVEGDSLDSSFPASSGWIRIYLFDDGILQSASLGSGTTGAGKAAFTSLAVSKLVGPSSIGLFAACAQGGIFPHAQLALRGKAGPGVLVPFYTAVLRPVAVRSIVWQGSSGDDQPLEQVVLDFGQLQWTYIQLGESGQPLPAHTVHWDAQANTGGTGPLPGLQTTPPQIQCPAPILADATAGACSAVVLFNVSTAGGPAGPPTVVSVPPSGSSFLKGTTSVTSFAIDSMGVISSCSFRVTVGQANPPPAAADALGTVQGTPLIFAATNLLRNDSGGQSPMTVAAVSPTSSSGGTVTLLSGQITYSPPANFTGGDVFTYTAANGCYSSIGTVSVVVLASNTPSLYRLSLSRPGGLTEIQFMGLPTRQYQIESASDLGGPWTTLSPALTPGTNFLLQFEDPADPPPPRRFYRAVPAAPP